MLQERFINLSQASALIPVVTGIRNYKVLTRPFKFMLYFFILTVLFEIQSIIAIEIWTNNMPGQHLLTVVEFLSFSILYYSHTRKRTLRLLITINALIFFTIAIWDAIWGRGIWISNDLARGYAASSMIVYVLGYLYYLFTIDDTRYMWEYPMFWICIGALVYFAGNSPYILSKLQLIETNLGVEWLFHLVHGGLNIIANCLYAQSFRCFKKQETTAAPQSFY